MALLILRLVFILMAAGVGVTVITSEQWADASAAAYWGVFLGLLIMSILIIAGDMSIRRKQIDMVTCFYFGILIGLLITYLFGIALEPAVASWLPDYRAHIQLVLAVVLCYMCTSLLIQTKDDFRFIIPYIEFSKEVRGSRPFLLDTSAVIDGRIADVVDSQLLDAPLILPRFMLLELQNIADSGDKLRRNRGRRGLDILNRLQNDPKIDLKIYDREFPEFDDQPNDLKLVLLAERLGGKIVTCDFNLNKVSRLHDIDVINLNELSKALKPALLPGEQIEVMIVKRGEEANQGVGYLEDGTMLVVEDGADCIQQNILVSITSVLQTNAGRMLFGRKDYSDQENGSSNNNHLA